MNLDNLSKIALDYCVAKAVRLNVSLFGDLILNNFTDILIKKKNEKYESIQMDYNFIEKIIEEYDFISIKTFNSVKGYKWRVELFDWDDKTDTGKGQIISLGRTALEAIKKCIVKKNIDKVKLIELLSEMKKN